MKRFWLCLAIGVIIQGLVLLFLYFSPRTSLPPILDWILAPGFLLLVWFPFEGGLPPGIAESEHRSLIVIGAVINVAIYASIVFVILRLRDKLKRPKSVAA